MVVLLLIWLMEVRILLVVLVLLLLYIFHAMLLPPLTCTDQLNYLYMLQIFINYVNMKIALNTSGWLQSPWELYALNILVSMVN